MQIIWNTNKFNHVDEYFTEGDFNLDGVVDGQDFIVWNNQKFTNYELNDAPLEYIFGFTGRMYDDEIGMQNNLNRWYDAEVGRWISEDPISFAGGDANLYRYVGNSPTNYIDPNGLQHTETQNNDGSSSVAVEDNTIVILYGHGNKNTPHSFSFNGENSYGVFVGCDAGATNKGISKEHRLDSAKLTNGDITTGGLNHADEKKTSKYWKDKAIEEARCKAHDILDDNKDVDQVTIQTETAGPDWAWSDNTWSQPPRETIVVTR